jgi:hypothetical protein
MNEEFDTKYLLYVHVFIPVKPVPIGFDSSIMELPKPYWYSYWFVQIVYLAGNHA